MSLAEVKQGFLSKKRRKRGRGMGGPMPPVLLDEGYQDRIAKAVEREREHRRVSAPERDSVAGHLFRCVCCGRVRSEEERREPKSELCMRCVREAGFWN